ncbi:MAG: (Fe-S)-binding protein [Myxococcales bacterium]|nr:MAG: (Fe-S)-binding protein [Myxococcales bacterium]
MLAKFARDFTYCNYCPKLCSYSCPVSTVEGNESLSPWALMRSAGRALESETLPSEETQAAWYACTGCMRCTEHCRHGNAVPAALYTAREQSLKSKGAPKRILALVDSFEERQQQLKAQEQKNFGPYTTEKSSVAFVPGCASVRSNVQNARDNAELVASLCEQPPQILSARCCGLPLLESGDIDGFRKQATLFLEPLNNFGVSYFQDPSCLHALLKLAPQFGITHQSSLHHVSELCFAKLNLFTSLGTSASVHYHDACRLSRGLGIFNEPRAVLSKILDRPVNESKPIGDSHLCAGSCGQFPASHPDIHQKLNKELISELGLQSGEQLVHCCPSTVASLNQQAGTTVASDFGSFVAKSLRYRKELDFS